MQKVSHASKQYFLLSPYLFSLISFGLAGLCLLTFLSCCFVIKSGSDLRILIIVFLPVLVFLFVSIINAHEFWGVVCITEEKITVMAPFRKPLRFYYEDIADIGIDSCFLSVHDQFWIYVGKSIVPAQYCHNINRLPINSDYLRIQYSPKSFACLCQMLPSKLKKRLENSQTILPRR